MKMHPGFMIVSRSVTPEDVAIMDQYFNQVTDELGIPKWSSEEFGFQIRSAEDEFIGNLNGKISWNWMLANLLWVRKDYHRQGLGRALMEHAEDIARQKNLTGIYLWTASWQAEEFYKKLGYQEFTRFDDFPPGQQRIGLRKYL